MKCSILFLFSCFFLFSCQQTGSNVANNTGVAIPKFTTIVGEKSFYKQFKGTLGTQSITLNLIKKPSNYATSGTGLSGYFYYNNEEKPIPVSGSIDDKGIISLDTWLGDGNNSFFNGKQSVDGIFLGTWADTVSMPHKSLAFSLCESYDNRAVPFDYFYYTDSLNLFKNVKDSPKASFVAGILIPSPAADKTIADFLNKIFLTTADPNYSLEDTTPMNKRPQINYPDAATMFKTQRDVYFKDYLETNKNTKPGEDFQSNFSNESSVSVLYNSGDLLSIGETIYTYMGGAHGMINTTLSSYQLQNKKKLGLDDLFKPGYQPVVSKLLEAGVRKQFNIKPTDPLSGTLFVDKLEVTDNFAVTNKGILFLYNSDEIASHAQGEISVFIPFSDLKRVLKM